MDQPSQQLDSEEEDRYLQVQTETEETIAEDEEEDYEDLYNDVDVGFVNPPDLDLDLPVPENRTAAAESPVPEPPKDNREAKDGPQGVEALTQRAERESNAGPARIPASAATSTPSRRGNSDYAERDSAENSGSDVVLFVGNLQWWTTDADLEAALSEYGRVKSMEFSQEKASGKSRGSCDVEFYDYACARACKEGMNGRVFDGRACVVTFKNSSKPRQMRDGMVYRGRGGNHQDSQSRRMVDGSGGGQLGSGGGRVGSGGEGGRGYASVFIYIAFGIRNPVDGGLGETMDNLPPSSPEDYLRKALSDGRLIDSEALPRIVLYCERAQPSDAAEILKNMIPENGEQVITEYLHRRSLGSIYDSKDDSPDKPMRVYRKPVVSSTGSSTGKNKNKVRQSKEATQSIRATDRTHEHDGVSTRPGDNGKEHIQEREGTLSVPLQNLRRGEPCDCQARRHNLLNNCLGCGKVICEQEGEGPCSFCGSEVWHHDRPIQHLRGPSEQISESEEKANVLKNKLLAYDRNEKSQTTIIDDQSDYFNIDGNSWLSPEEKKKLQREELEKAENVSQRRTVLLLDPAGRKVSVASEDDIHEDIQRTDVSSYFANRENFQKFHVEPSPNIKTHPVYIDVGKSRQRIDSRSKRIPDSMRIRSGRVKHEFSDLHSSTGRAILDAFDICIPKDDTVKLSSPLYVQSKDNDKITEYHEGRSKIQVLKSGLVLLKNWLSRNDQINIVQQCQRLGVGEGGFYQPSFGGNRKMHLWMMCLGNDWDPESRSYGQIRHYDNAVPPPIPAEFVPLVYRAIDESHDALRKNKKFKGEDVERILPYMDPDVCIVNFYKETGRLGLHQDKDESRRSLFRGLPVVSFSLGDSAEFLYGTERDIDKAEKILLESGDVLIFGGESRHVFHGISHVNPHTSPKWLNQETGLRPGRLNLTFRQI